MTKQEILDEFDDIDFVYNNSSKHETLSQMLDELLKEQEAVLSPSHLWETYSQTRHGECPKCGADINEYDNSKCCGRCGQEVKWDDDKRNSK